MTPDDVEHRSMWLWDVLFAVATLGTCVLVALDDQPVAHTLGAITVVVACGVGWPLAARRMALDGAPDTRPVAAAYAVAITVGLVVAVALAPAANWAAFVVLSQLFWLVPLRFAIAGTVLLAMVLPVTTAAVRGADLAAVVGGHVPQALFMTLFGVLVGIYIHRVSDESAERARLIAELERAQTEVAELSHRTGAAAERERLAGEIHDTLAQGFTSIVTLLQAAQAEFDTDGPAARRHVELAVRSAKENLREARHLVAASTPGALATHSLTDAVGRQVQRFAEETGVQAAHGASGEPRRLPAEQEIVLLRAAQELLANVAKHAGARTVTVRLDFRDPAAVALTVADDGAGFDRDAVPDGHYGLAMMRGRAERLGGTLLLGTAPGAGTTATLTLPAKGPA